MAGQFIENQLSIVSYNRTESLKCASPVTYTDLSFLITDEIPRV